MEKRINKMRVRTVRNATWVDVPSQYYDITQAGKIIFNKNLFKTSVTGTPSHSLYYTAPIVPGGANYLPNLYGLEISSTGSDGAVYPTINVGFIGANPAQAVGYGLSFDSQGGATISPLVFGYRPSLSKVGPNSSDFAIGQAKT